MTCFPRKYHKGKQFPSAPAALARAEGRHLAICQENQHFQISRGVALKCWRELAFWRETCLLDIRSALSHRAPALGIYQFKNSRRKQMKNLILNSLHRLQKDEAGQGIVEYMLIIALVAFAATAGMSSLASGVNSAMTKIASILGVYIS